jgi:hypothetical protein
VDDDLLTVAVLVPEVVVLADADLVDEDRVVVAVLPFRVGAGLASTGRDDRVPDDAPSAFGVGLDLGGALRERVSERSGDMGRRVRERSLGDGEVDLEILRPALLCSCWRRAAASRISRMPRVRRSSLPENVPCHFLSQPCTDDTGGRVRGVPSG